MKKETWKSGCYSVNQDVFLLCSALIALGNLKMLMSKYFSLNANRIATFKVTDTEEDNHYPRLMFPLWKVN